MNKSIITTNETIREYIAPKLSNYGSVSSLTLGGRSGGRGGKGRGGKGHNGGNISF